MNADRMVDYQETCETFRWPRPERFNFATDVMDEWTVRQPGRLALLCVSPTGGEQRRTFRELADNSRGAAALLKSMGLKRGDVLLLILPAVPAWWELITACLRMGIVASPGTTQLSAKDIAYRIQASNAAGIVTDAANCTKVENVEDRCPSLVSKLLTDGHRDGWYCYPDELESHEGDCDSVSTAGDENALCYFTSGTTGFPKMVMHTQASLGIGHQVTGRYWLGLQPGDLHWNIGDPGWAKAAYSSYFGPFSCGASVFADAPPKFDARRALGLLGTYAVTHLCAAPTVYRMLVLENFAEYEMPALKRCFAAGEPLNPETIEKWKAGTGHRISEGYGQTETVLLCASFDCIEYKPGSMGKQSPGFDLQIVDDEGEILPPGVEGQIAVRVKPERPVGILKEYWKSEEKNRQTFVGNFYLTGDRAVKDEDGYFWFVSRADDIILSAGYRIGPFEVESALLEHPSVVESAVVSSPDEQRGEIVKAFVVLKANVSPTEKLKEELQEHVKFVTAPYKYPRKIEFVTELPKTVSGKIRRVELRAREWAARKRT
jgi:acetyl-CoA synthetase/medium-chain acyl-CoA synthetase